MKISKQRIVLYNLTAIFYWMALYLYVPYIAPYLNVMGVSATIIGYISSFYGIGMLLNRVPFGLAGDRTGAHKAMCITGIILATVSAFGMRITKNPLLFMLFRFLAGAGVSAWVNFVSLYTSYFEGGRTSRAVATMNLMANIGHVGAAVAGGITASLFGYRELFLFAGFAGVIALLLSFLVVDYQGAKSPNKTIGSLLSVGKEKSVMIAAGLGIMLQLIPYATTYTFTNILARDIGASEGQLGVLQAITNFAGMLAPWLFASKISERIPEKNIIAVSFLLYTVSLLFFPRCIQVWQMYICQFLSGLGFGAGCTPLMNLSIRFVAPEKRSTALGCFLAIYSLGLMLGPILMGYFIQYGGYAVGYYIMAAVSFVSAIAAYNVFNRFLRAKGMR